jgi:signal transduction histidine kinase
MTAPADAPESHPHGTDDSALTHFAARVAHDFNNLLTAILGNLELMQLRAARDHLSGLDSYFTGANGAGGRAIAFAARLMAYSGRSAGTPVRVHVDTVLAGFSPLATCRLAANDAVLLCDPDQLELAVTELLENANEAGGKVTITSAQAGAEIIVTVSDTGRGMEPETLARAVEPFFSTAAHGTGRGLGLPIVARVVQELGGSIGIEAKAGGGCTVTLRLPRA